MVQKKLGSSHKRSIKASVKTGKLSRKAVAAAVRGVHVTQIGKHKWAVRTTSKVRKDEVVSSKKVAISQARKLAAKQRVNVIVHTSTGKVVIEGKHPKVSVSEAGDKD